MAAACRWCAAMCTKRAAKIALASVVGKETRFKVTLPVLENGSGRAGRLIDPISSKGRQLHQGSARLHPVG